MIGTWLTGTPTNHLAFLLLFRGNLVNFERHRKRAYYHLSNT